jgi:thermitase
MSSARPSIPFGDDYSDVRSPEAMAREREQVSRQVAALIEHSDPDFTVRYAQTLQERREGSAAVAIEPIARRDGGRVLVARRSYLVRRDSAIARRPSLQEDLAMVVADDHESSLIRLEDDPTKSLNARTSTVDLLERLRATDPEAELNYIVPLGGGGVVLKVHGGQEPTTGLRPFPAVPIPSSGVAPLVAVIDTGISLERRTDGYQQNLLHPDNLDPLDVLPFPTRDGLLDACAGHGSFVTGVVQQVAPSARLRIYKVTDPEGIGTDYQVAAAIRRAAADGAQIINISMGTPTVDGNPPPAMAEAIRELPEDVLVVCAAGNDGNDVMIWPAALSMTLPNVVAVAGLDAEGQPSSFSSHGGWITCSAIGQGVVSTYVIGREDGNVVGNITPDTFAANSWAVGVGTSYAAPQITGGVARRVHEQGESPRAALAKLLDGAPDDVAGWGKRVRILPGT